MPELTPPPSEKPRQPSDSRLVFRELTPAEWPRLLNLPPAPAGPLPEGFVLPDPETSSIIIAEKAGEIVGLWMLVFMAHMEGFWLKNEPSIRTGRNIIRLIETTRTLLDKAHIPSTFCWSSPELGDLCRRVGMTRLEDASGTPLETYVFHTDPACPSSSPPYPPEPASSGP